MASLVSCKACGHQVAQTAKSCPNCGVKNPGMTWKQHLATAVFLIVITLIIMKACSSDDESVTPVVSQAQVDVSQAKDYQVISSEDFSFPGRKRIQINIAAPDATSYEELAQTAIKAALDFQKQQNANVVYIFLGDDNEMIDSGDAQAIARYAPDGGGNSGDQDWTWQVEASEPLTETENKTIELWESHGDNYRLEGSWDIDEEAFKTFAAEKLGIPVSEVILRDLKRETYTINLNN